MRTLIVLLLLLIAAPARATLTINDASSPRLFNITPARLAEIRAACAVTGSWEKAACDSLIKPYADQYLTGNYTRSLGLMGYDLFSGTTDTRYHAKMLANILDMHNAGYDRPSADCEGAGWAHLNMKAWAFDWYYAEFAAAHPVEAAAIATDLANARNCNPCADTSNGPWVCTLNLLCPLLASYGRTGNAALDAQVYAKLVEVVGFYDGAICNCMDGTAGFPGVSPYGDDDHYHGTREAVRVVNYLILKSGTNYTGPMDTAGFIDDAWLSWQLQLRSYPQTFTEPGKTRTSTTIDYPPGKALIDEAAVPTMCAALYAASGNEQSLGLASYILRRRWNFRRLNDSFDPVLWLLWIGGKGQGADWTAAPKSMWSPERGWYRGVQRHELSTTATRVKLSYYADLGSFDQTGAVGHFEVSVGSGRGAWRADHRGDDLDAHFAPYASRQIARNCVVIQRPGETPQSPSWSWSAKGSNSACSATPDSLIVRDRGYTIKGDAHGPDITGATRWPHCVWAPPNKSVEPPTSRGFLMRFAEDDDFVSIAHTMDDAYKTNKQAGVARGMTWAKLPDNIGQGFFLVWDRIGASSGTTRVQSLLHVVDAPHANGTLTWVAGAGQSDPAAIRYDFDGAFGSLTLDSWGGIYRSTNSSKIFFDDQGARFCVYPLSVTASLGDAPRTYLIGGPNSLGQHWKQDWIPCYPDSWGEQSFEYWYGGKNYVPGAWLATTCGVTSCTNGTQIWRFKTSLSHGPDPTNRNTPTPQNKGYGAPACDARIELGWDNLTVPNGQTSTCDIVYGMWAGPNTVAPGALPTVYGERTGDLFAYGYKPSGGTAYSVLVVQRPDDPQRLTGATYANPMFGSAETGSQLHRIPWLGEDRRWSILGDGAAITTADSDTNGTLLVSIPSTVETVTIERGDIVYPPPTPPPGPVPYTLAHARLYHPRERTVLQAGGGTLLALYYGQGDYGTPIYAQLSRDDGQTWRDLDGNQDSSTEIMVDDEAAGPNRYTPRGDFGFAAALDPVSNDLWIFAPYVRMNSSHVEIASLVRAQLFPWDGTTWSTLASFAWNGFEGPLRSKPRECVARVSAGRQFYAAWAGKTGSNWNVQSVRIKNSTATTLSSSAAKADSSQYPQLLEYPRGTMWLLSSVREGASQDSIRVRKATDGSSAQWGVTTHVPLEAIGARGEWGAVVGPSGPWLAIRDEFDDRYRYAYWTGAAWVTGFAPLELTVGDHPTVTADGISRVVLTSTHGSTLARAYWSLVDGWSSWADAWTATGLGYAHVTALRAGEFLALGTVSAAAEFAVGRFSLPPETEPTGACCAGGCFVLTYDACIDLGGTWQGPHVPCSPDPCEAPPEVGACCYPDGSCVQTTEAACGGVYAGDRVSCPDAHCPSGPPSLAGRRRKVILAARE